MIGGAKGIGIGIDFGIPNQYCRATSKPYIEKDVLDSLRVVASAYGKSNNDADRSIVKNLVDASNPFIISNTAFKLNSGFGKYSADFESFDWAVNISQKQHNKATISLNGRLCNHTAIEVDEMKVNIIGNVTELIYWYIANPDDTTRSEIRLTSGINTLPKSYAKDDGQTYNIGFAYISGDSEITIEQIPSFEGAFVTDGINDLITSTKTASEMGITNEVTVISMIHQIGGLNSSAVNYGYTNYFRGGNQSTLRNNATGLNKTGIYGYSATNYTPTVINNILGDKNDYTTSSSGFSQSTYGNVFSVVGYKTSDTIAETSSVAWYWTIIANKVLTTDQINQVIAYFNLDRTLKPDILCNTIKQGITNENHAEFGDKLIDFSGNGRDIQLNNLAWKGGSGIAAKQYETFKDWTNTSYQTSTVTEIDEFTRVVDSTSNAYWVSMINRTSDFDKVHDSINIVLYQDDMLLVHECKYKIDENVTTKALYETLKSGINTITLATIDKFTDIPEDAEIMSLGEWVNPKSNKGSVKITLLPSYKGGLLLDGVNDFGKVTGMPIYKDYTVVTDREIFANAGAISSKNNPGAFVETAGNTVYSFGQATSGLNFISTRSISYLSKYSYCGQSITAGAAEDGTDMWLGTIRDNDSRFFNGAIYSLMSFPYSMSEFLIERQLKKHKLGTLYPNMVEFRPVIKSSVELVNKPSFAIRGTSTLLNAGDYIPENSEIWVVITMNNVADRITKFVINGNTIDIPSSAYNPSTMKYGFPFTIDSKSPQKITMTIEQDENYVKWNPVVESNVEYQVVDSYIDNYPAVVGNYYPINSQLRIAVTTKGAADEVTSLTINGTSLGTPSVNGNRFTFNGTLSDKSPQKIDITIDEYIRYEDIVQPYPMFFEFYNENNELFTWGGKVKVGSTITRTKGVAYSNLLEGLYTITNPRLNGVQLVGAKHTVEKQMVFTCNATYIKGSNAPKCILSPSRLRIPNSSYKILGYIPDLSGNGNHGKINNSAYAGMSGANGYPNNFNGYTVVSGVTKTDSAIKVEKELTGSGWLLLIPANTAVASMKLNIVGIPSNKTIKWSTNVEGIGDITLVNGINEIPTYTSASTSGIYTIFSDLKDLKIEQIGEYEGAYCLDGVDDFISIPTLSSGGKQVAMKVNWDTIDAVLYDQRTDIETAFAIGTGNETIAYNHINIGGSTYIDGILNEYILTNNLQSITHNIVCNNNSIVANSNVYIGKNFINGAYAKMSLYDFMLFDDISTDEEILNLNKYIGIEPKVELPPYYWDTYGKTNFDADKATIQQRGVAIGDYDLTNYNHTYEGMSGYNGYPVVFGANKTWANESNGYVTSITSNTIHITNVLNAGLALLYSYVKYNGNLQNIKEIPPFKIEIKGLEGRSKFIYKYLATSDATKETNLYLENGTHELPKSFLPTEALINNAVVGFSISPIEEGVTNFLSDITIKVLPEYENGLVYDGVEDYSVNTNIPALTDYTYVIKRENLNNNVNSATMYKGNKVGGGAFIVDYIASNGSQQYSYGNPTLLPLNENTIIYGTKTSYNGSALTVGSNTDENGLDIGHWSSNY